MRGGGGGIQWGERKEGNRSLWSPTSIPPAIRHQCPRKPSLSVRQSVGAGQGSWKARRVAVRRPSAETDRDLEFSSFLSLCDLWDEFEFSHSFDNVIYNPEIISIFSPFFLILYALLIKYPNFSSWKSLKNSPDLISSQYLSPDHLNVMFWEICGAHCYWEEQRLGGKVANSSFLQLSIRLLFKVWRREHSHCSSWELQQVSSRHGQIMSSHGKPQGVT